MKQLYIKWNEKLDISLKEIKIKSEDTKESNNNFGEIKEYLQNAYYFKQFIQKLVIEKIIYNNVSASINYEENVDGYLIASSPNLSFKSLMTSNKNSIKLHVYNSTLKKEKIRLSGNILLNLKKPIIDTDVVLNINSDINLHVKLLADTKKLKYKITATQDIKNIKYLFSFIKLNKYVKYWADDAISMDSFSLHSVDGWVEYDKIDDAYKNLHATATLNKLNYKYNPKLDAIHSQTTDIEFRDGVLYIRPKGAKSYNSQLGKSWLKIDFTTKEELLTLHLLFNGMLDKNILHVLSRYKINIPFLQKKGTINTNLTLVVNLQTIDIDAKGKFIVKKGNFDYQGLNLAIANTTLLLNNFDVKINKMTLKYKDIAQANVKAKYNAKKGQGVINFDIDSFKLDNMNIKLNKNLHASYHINSKQDILSIDKSQWLYDTHTMSIDAITMPFDLKKMRLNLPTTFVQIDNVASAYISGLSSLKEKKTDLDINILKFNHNGIKLTQSLTPLKLTYNNDDITIYNEEPITFNLYGKDAKISQTVITFNKNTLNLKPVNLTIENQISSLMYATYNLKYKQGMINLDKFKTVSEDYGEVFNFDKPVHLYTVLHDDTFHVVSKNLQIDFLLTHKLWTLKLNSIKKILKYSPLLQKYHISEGSLSIKNNQKPNFIHFNADIMYPYKFFIQNNLPINHYNIIGTIDTHSDHTVVALNNKIEINIDDDIKIDAKDIGFNIPEIVNFYNNTNIESNNKKNRNIIFHSKNCYLYFTKYKHIISDSINLQYYNDIVTAQLKHDKGNAGFKLDNKTFHFYGENFNNKFMEHLFTLSKFYGGSLDFNIDGTFDDYDGIIYIKDTTVLDYKVLNNILAFVNTVPSLVTFSLPGYSKKGLPVKNAYMKFHANKTLFNISDIYMHSKELDIIGHGTTDVDKNSINLQLNLKTDIGSNLQKIPLVGYIILGNDRISTTLSVTGKLTDPKIHSLIAKDIAVAPFNIIKRTLLLPFHLFSKDKK